MSDGMGLDHCRQSVNLIRHIISERISNRDSWICHLAYVEIQNTQRWFLGDLMFTLSLPSDATWV